MKLAEMSPLYEDSARRIQRRMEELRLSLRSTEDPECTRQLQAYFDGALTAFDLPLNPQGTPFHRKVWAALQEIPYGETRSYGQMAAALGCPGAARAVGGANHHNPIAIIIPCHRVIGADGSLTGYGGGLDMKDWLLRHERRHSHA